MSKMSKVAKLVENRSPVTLALIAFTSLYVLYHLTLSLITYHRRTRLARELGCKPMASWRHKEPFFGLDILLEDGDNLKNGGFMEGIQERFQKLNSYTFSSNFLGDRVVHTAEPENIKAILATQFKDFELPPKRKAAMCPTFGHGIFTTDGKEWETSRALLRPSFARHEIADLDTFERHIEKLMARIPRNGETFDLQQLFFMLTMDSATEFLFGKSSDVLELENSEERDRGVKFQEAFTYITTRMGLMQMVGKLATIFPNKEFDDGMKFVHEYIGKYIQKAVELRKSGFAREGTRTEEKGKARYVFLEELARQNVGEKKIQDELLSILLAGRDTTAGLLSYLFYTLARRKDVLEKLRAEVDSLGGGKPTFEQLKNMKYLQYTLNETLRLHPVVPINNRTSVKDTTLPVGGGPDRKAPVFIKKGTHINYMVYVMHRRKDIYGEDAEEFKPERWETLRLGWQYLPFNGGPRICIGQQFALTEAAYTTVRLLQSFQGLEPRDNGRFTDFLSLTSAVYGGVKVAMVPA